MTVVDPTDENVAILNDGTIGFAFRLAPNDAFADPDKPTVAVVNAVFAAANTIVGYGSFMNVRWA